MAGDRSGWDERARRWAAFGLPFVLVVYLALRGGGYDAIARGEVGVAISWMLLLGAILGVLPAARFSRAAWVALGAIAAFAAWTALGLVWTESRETTFEEVARLVAYGLVLVLVLAIQGRRAWRATLGGVAAAIALVGVLALASRLVPSAFPADEAARQLDVARARLNYPVNYWNGLAALLAVGMPLLAAIAMGAARRLAAAVAASAVIPAIALACFYTLSRGGALEVAVGLVALFALHPRRLRALATLTPALAAAAILLVLAGQRDALENGLRGGAADDQRMQMIVAVLICAALAAGGRWLVEHAVGRFTLAPPRPSAATGRAVGAACALAAIVVVAAGLPARLDDAWREFKSEAGPAETGARFGSASGNGRYQYWSAAVDANATDPLIGIGPGAYRYYWARAGSTPGVVRDAHSLYLQTLAEAGIVGFSLVIVAFGTLLVFAVARALRAPPRDRPWLAAAGAACFTFATAAAVDWVWQLAVVPVAFLCVVGAIVGSARSPDAVADAPPARLRVAIGALGLVGAVLIALPLAADLLVQESQRAVVAGELPDALGDAQRAEDVAPWAASPRLQEALVLEQGGDLAEAADAAREATAREDTNWRPWLALSRIQYELGNGSEGASAYRRARDLNPRSPLLASPPTADQ